MANEFFSEDKVSEIRERASILEVVSDYVSLKKTGKNHKGLCPFHSEKTPSFMVNEDKQIFHCFGCGEGGDVFTFLMKAGHFSFPQAVEELANRYGIQLLRRERSPARQKELAKREVLFQINQTVSEYFHDLLTRKKEGHAGKQYLARRNVKEEIIREHRLGYASERWDGLVQHLREKKVSLEMAWELGLILPKKKGGALPQREDRKNDPTGWYDAFRGRIIFPIVDLHQRVVGFGGRLIGEGQPKYLNSSESSLYHKGDILYGLQVAKRFASEKDCIIIVEGYFDLLTLHQYGLKHSVATLGTALTPQQIRILKRYTRNLIVLFDPDQAGIQATLRLLPLFLEEEVSGKAILLPKGEDPDTFLKKGNLNDFERRSEKAVPLIDFFFESLTKTHNAKTIDGRVNIAKEGMALIRRIPDRIRRDFYVRALAERLDIQEPVLHEMIQLSPEHRRPSQESQKGKVERSFLKSEEMVIRLMLHFPDLIPVVFEDGVLNEFESSVLKSMGLKLGTLHRERGKLELAQIMEAFEEDPRSLLREYAFQENGVEESGRERILKDCIQKIHGKKLKKDGNELLKRIKEVERKRGENGLEALLMEHQELTKREKGFRK